MSKYKTLIFDLDDTLVNNTWSMKYAFSLITIELGIDFSEELYKAWKKFDDNYWHLFESGKINIPPSIKTINDKVTYLRANRFLVFFRNLNLSFERAVYLNNVYTNNLGARAVEISGARELLKSLYQSQEIIIATNGPRNQGLEKLERTKLRPYITEFICSEEIGFSKPMPEFFEHLESKIQNKNREQMLIVGDNLSTDILMGMNEGIDTCWFNPDNKVLTEEYQPTMTIKRLLELKYKC